MGQAKREGVERDGRRDLIESICTDAKALEYDEVKGETTSNEDPDADKEAFARVFRAWADGKFTGTADEIFETTKEVLEL
jgi:hypothetical protein